MTDFLIRLNRWDDTSRSLYVRVPISDHEGLEVSVSQSTSLDDGKPELAMINWPAIGAIAPKWAEVFGQGLIEAARVAREIEKIEEWGSDILADWREYSCAEQEAGRKRPWPRAMIHAGVIRVIVPADAKVSA